MAKSKKLSQKLRQFYKGAAKRPTKVVNEEEMKIISEALEDCLPKRSTNLFKCKWMGHDMELKMVVGLSAGLRLLRRKQTKALILDSTAADHVTNLLSEFTIKLNIPVIIADRLIIVAPKLGLKNLLLISLVDGSNLDDTKYNDKDPRPKQIESSVEVDSFNKLVAILETKLDSSTGSRPTFRNPKLVQIKSSGRSQAKKIIKKK